MFSGTCRVQLDVGEDAEDLDHLITPEERLRVANGEAVTAAGDTP